MQLAMQKSGIDASVKCIMLVKEMEINTDKIVRNLETDSY